MSPTRTPTNRRRSERVLRERGVTPVKVPATPEPAIRKSSRCQTLSAKKLELESSFIDNDKSATPKRNSKAITAKVSTPKLEPQPQHSQKKKGQEVKKSVVKNVESSSPSLPCCREKQFDEILDFARKGIEEKDSRCLYVSGVPGTGKTLVVKAVIKTLQKDSSDKFIYIFVNSLNLGNPERIWNRVHDGLTGTKANLSVSAAFKKVEQILRSKHLPIILVVDELDQLLDKRQNILYRILEWTNDPIFKLSFIAIFNTINLPETALAARNASRMGFGRTVFPPYTHQELQLIVAKHLGEGKANQLQDALILLSKKVAGISGDARRAIEIATRTIEIMESKGQSSGVKAIQDAFKELFTSPHIQCLKFCSKLEKDVIRVLAHILQATGTDDTMLSKVISSVIEHGIFEGVRWSVDQILGAVSRLYASRLIFIETARPSIHGRITLAIAIEDVNFAFGNTMPNEN